MLIRILIILSIVLIGFISCDDTTEFKFTKEELIHIDSSSFNIMQEITPELDSLCKLNTAELRDLAIDSLKVIRVEEILSILEEQRQKK